MSPFCVVVFRVGIPTEAKPCSLGRSGSAPPNERRSDLLPGVRCPHRLVGLAPGMVFFRLPHHHRPGARGKRGRGFLGLLLQLRKSDCFSPVVHLHGSVLPLADQSLASCGAHSVVSRASVADCRLHAGLHSHCPIPRSVSKRKFSRSSRAVGLRP